MDRLNYYVNFSCYVSEALSSWVNALTARPFERLRNFVIESKSNPTVLLLAMKLFLVICVLPMEN